MEKIKFEYDLYSEMIGGFVSLLEECKEKKISLSFEADGIRVSEIGNKKFRTEFFRTPTELKMYLNGIEDGYYAKEKGSLAIYKPD